MSNDSSRPIPLSELARELRTLAGESPSYQSLHRSVASGRLPAFRIGRQWFFHRDDLPAVVAELGLSLPVAA